MTLLKKERSRLFASMQGTPSEFVRKLWHVHPVGYVFLAARQRSWEQMAFPLPIDMDLIVSWLEQHASTKYDLYFCPNAFSQPFRRSEFAFDTPYAWCDIDDGNLACFDPQPSILTMTSPGRHQGIWIFREKVEPTYAEATSRHLTYSFGGDKNGWSATKFLRLPFTINHKSSYDEPHVRLLKWRENHALDWPTVTTSKPLFLDPFVIPRSGDAEAVIRRYSPQIEPKYVSLMRNRRLNSPDRSRCIFMIVAALHGAKATKREIALVLQRSPYFIDKYGEDEHALEKEISRITAKLDRERE